MIQSKKLFLICVLVTLIAIDVFSAPTEDNVNDDDDDGDDDNIEDDDDDNDDGDDVQLTDEQVKDLRENQMLESSPIQNKYKWPRTAVTQMVIVPYRIRKRDYPDDALQVFEEGMADIMNKTCIRFVKRKLQENFIFIHDSGKGKCSSRLGKVGGRQPLRLTPGCMMIRKKCVHELIHALGFHHMHQRYDRDTALTIHWENIDETRLKPFEKYNNKWEAYKTPYDVLSCMHYARNGFSKNGKDTIVTKDPEYQDIIGKSLTLSDGDATRINRMYKCPAPYD